MAREILAEADAVDREEDERYGDVVAMSCLPSWRPCMDGGIAIDALHHSVYAVATGVAFAALDR